MASSIRHALLTVLLGLLLAGPLAAVALAGTPDRWRGPWIPVAAAAVALAAVALLRRSDPPAGRE